VSDPGAILVRAASDAGFSVLPIPGPSAVTAAVSASGLVDGSFTFLGFLPRAGNQRREALTQGLASGLPLVVYESGPRIEAIVKLIAELAPERLLVVFRELTKIHEEAIRGTAVSIVAAIAFTSRKGEFVVVIGPGTLDRLIDSEDLIDAGIERGERATDIAREVARITGDARSEVYDRVLEQQRARTGGQGA